MLINFVYDPNTQKAPALPANFVDKFTFADSSRESGISLRRESAAVETFR